MNLLPLLICLMHCACVCAAEIPALRGLSRTDLLEIRTSAGLLQKAKVAADWEGRRKDAVKAFESVAGPFPRDQKRCPLEMLVEEEVDCGSYVRRMISYASSPGGRVPAYLCVPKAALAGVPASAVLCLHPTDNVVGNQVVVGLGGKANRQYAAELAERGFVTLSPSYPLLAKYQPDFRALGFESGTMKAIWDNVRGIDLLESLAFVQKESGFAVIGHSLGGHNGIFTAVFEPRIRAVVSSCGFDSFLDYKGGNVQGWVQQRYMPKMAEYVGRSEQVPFDFYELVGALAPRAFLVNAPRKDANFRWDSVDRVVVAARAVYEIHGVPQNIQVMHPDCEHDFPDAERVAGYEWIERVLGGRQ